MFHIQNAFLRWQAEVAKKNVDGQTILHTFGTGFQIRMGKKRTKKNRTQIKWKLSNDLKNQFVNIRRRIACRKLVQF